MVFYIICMQKNTDTVSHINMQFNFQTFGFYSIVNCSFVFVTQLIVTLLVIVTEHDRLLVCFKICKSEQSRV